MRRVEHQNRLCWLPAGQSPPKPIQVVNNTTSPNSARTFNCASYSFFGSADSRNEHSIESPHSIDAAKHIHKEIGPAKEPPAAADKSEGEGSDSAPDGSASDRTASVKQDFDSGVEAGFAPMQGQTGSDEDHGVPTDEEILMSHLNLGPGF